MKECIRCSGKLSKVTLVLENVKAKCENHSVGAFNVSVPALKCEDCGKRYFYDGSGWVESQIIG